MSGYKLIYFDVRGVVEVVRFAFALAKVPYEDFRYPFTFGTPGDFSTLSRPEFDAAKASGEFQVSMGKLPILEVDGQKIAQSKAIERFVAMRFGLMGAGPIEAAQIDQLCENIRDFKDAYNKAKSSAKDDDEKKVAMEKWFSQDLPDFVKATEASLPSCQGPWLVGRQPSLADLSWFQFIAAPKGFFDNAEGAKAAFQDCPRMKAAMEAVMELPEIQEWIAKRPDTMA